MAGRTVGFCAIEFLRFCQALSTFAIYLVRHWLQVSGIDAAPNTAKVVKPEAVRDYADEKLIRQAMRQQFLSAR